MSEPSPSIRSVTVSKRTVVGCLLTSMIWVGCTLLASAQTPGTPIYPLPTPAWVSASSPAGWPSAGPSLATAPAATPTATPYGGQFGPAVRTASRPPVPAAIGLPETPGQLEASLLFQHIATSDAPIELDERPTADMSPQPSYCFDECESFQILPQGLIYRSYLASEKESRFRSVWNYEKDNGWIWDITLGGRVGIMRYGTSGDARPAGIQLDIEGAGLPRLDMVEDRDVDAADFRFGIPLTWGNERYQVKIGYYHLSSHLGDEFLLKNPGYPRLNYSRDALVWGHSFYPYPELRLYAEVDYSFFADVAKPWEFQFGIEFAPAEATGLRGAPFMAFNAHLRQEVNYGGNFVGQIGWAWRRSPSSGLFRAGLQYFNGESEQFSFFDEHEEKFGMALWYDY